MSKSRPSQKQALIHQTASYSGPLPLPQHLEHYDKVLPGAADRIVSMAEREMAHRHSREKGAVKHGIVLSYLGQVFGFLIAALGLSGGIYCILQGNSWGGVGIGGVSLGSLVGIFVYGRKESRNP